MNFYANILESKQPVIGDDYFLQTKEEIENWLKEMKFKDYKINNDLTVDIKNVVINRNSSEKIPVKFRKVSVMLISNSALTSLKGCPDEIEWYFDVHNTKIKNLEHCPKKIGSDLLCYDNELTSLKGCPEIINGKLDCRNNELTSLEDLAKTTIAKDFDCSNNKLTSLKGCPEIITGSFDCSYNKLTSLEYFPVTGKNEIHIHNNPIKTLKGLVNMSAESLVSLIAQFPKLSWRNIEWDKVKNIDEITTELYENIEKGKYVDGSKEALKRIEELQLY